jgi:hypothetical protein
MGSLLMWVRSRFMGLSFGFPATHSNSRPLHRGDCGLTECCRRELEGPGSPRLCCVLNPPGVISAVRAAHDQSLGIAILESPRQVSLPTISTSGAVQPTTNICWRYPTRAARHDICPVRAVCATVRSRDFVPGLAGDRKPDGPRRERDHTTGLGERRASRIRAPSQLFRTKQLGDACSLSRAPAPRQAYGHG